MREQVEWKNGDADGGKEEDVVGYKSLIMKNVKLLVIWMVSRAQTLQFDPSGLFTALSKQ